MQRLAFNSPAHQPPPQLAPLSSFGDQCRENTMDSSSSERSSEDIRRDSPNRELDSPSPTSIRQDRKRAASRDVDGTSRTGFQNLNLSTPGHLGTPLDGGRDLICLCKTEPKIPRPRNAFILYRQHHQAGVSTQNPGLANPEISKIIGDKWKRECEETKSVWKDLAEEEKLRHQQQYPDYRYQPRRGTKGPGGIGNPSSAEEGGRCQKCWGRNIATPRTPSVPSIATAEAKAPAMPIPNPNYPEHNTSVGFGSSEGRRPSQGSVSIKSHFAGTRDGSPYINEELNSMSSSSDAKRRRFNGTGGYQALPGQPGQPGPPGHSNKMFPLDHRMSRQLSIGGLPPTGSGYPPQTLPAPSMLTRARPSPMGPPTRPSSLVFPANSRDPPFDASLRLPPLQTPVAQSPTSINKRVEAATHPSFVVAPSRADPQARSVEAMVMSIPFLNKLTVHRKISPPLALVSPGDPERETRGAVIAIEGADFDMLKLVAAVAERTLRACSEVAVKTWTARLPEEQRNADDERGRRNSLARSQDKLTAYLQLIMEWHEKSREIIQFVTTLPAPPEASATGPDATEANSDRGRAVAPAPAIPIALMPAGFSLTLSDKFACSTPIVDAYAPVDHWQWMATMWRGVVGPDLVLYVCACSEDELGRFGAVEFKSAGIMVVRIVGGKGLDEKTERRVAFELIEWVRSGSFRDSKSRGWT